MFTFIDKYYLNLPAGGTIVLLSLGIFGFLAFFKRSWQYGAIKAQQPEAC